MRHESPQGMKEQNKDDEWKKTNSGKIFEKLRQIAERDGKTLSVEGKGETIEVFHMGEETARLVKHLGNATSGENESGKIQLYVEAWEYKRRPWWREVLLAEEVDFQF